MRRAVFCALLLALAVSASAVSSSEAMELARPFISPGEQLSTLLDRPVVLYSGYYWLIYVHPLSSAAQKNMLIAVSESDGEIVSDEEVLSSLFSVSYDLDLKGSVSQKMGFSSLYGSVQSSLSRIQACQQGVSDLEYQLGETDSKLSMREVSSALSSLSRKMSSFNAFVQRGSDAENLFSYTYDQKDAESVVSLYSELFSEAEEIMSACDDYRKAVAEKRSEAMTDPSLTSDQREAVLSSLDNIVDVGFDSDFRYSSFEPAKKDFNSRLSKRDSVVGDYVSNFIYRKEKMDFDAKKEAVRPEVEELLNSKLALQACSIKTDDLEAVWGQVQALSYSSSSSSFVLDQKLSSLKKLVDSKSSAYLACYRAKTSSSSSSSSASSSTEIDFGPWPWLLLIAAIGAAGYYFYKKRLEEEGQ